MKGGVDSGGAGYSGSRSLRAQGRAAGPQAAVPRTRPVPCALALLAAIFGLVIAAADVEVKAMSGAEQAAAGRRLIWSDEFDGPEIDPETWIFEIGNGHANGIPGWGNDELQYYTAEPDNARIEDGKLVITALKERRVDRYGVYSYTSARMHTKGKVQIKYGLIEVRAKLPDGQGIWPAVWMLGADIDWVGWPRSGEIDIIELVGNRPGTVHGTVHGPKSAGKGVGGSYTLPDGRRFSEDFHVFALEWRPNGLTWYVDGEPYFFLSKNRMISEYGPDEWVFDKEYFFVVNLAVGGRWPGPPDETTTFPKRLEIDYIRVYALDEEAAAEGGS